jgi:hypothetical protein
MSITPENMVKSMKGKKFNNLNNEQHIFLDIINIDEVDYNTCEIEEGKLYEDTSTNKVSGNEREDHKAVIRERITERIILTRNRLINDAHTLPNNLNELQGLFISQLKNNFNIKTQEEYRLFKITLQKEQKQKQQQKAGGKKKKVVKKKKVGVYRTPTGRYYRRFQNGNVKRISREVYKKLK